MSTNTWEFARQCVIGGICGLAGYVAGTLAEYWYSDYHSKKLNMELYTKCLQTNVKELTEMQTDILMCKNLYTSSLVSYHQLDKRVIQLENLVEDEKQDMMDRIRRMEKKRNIEQMTLSNLKESQTKLQEPLEERKTPLTQNPQLQKPTSESTMEELDISQFVQWKKEHPELTQVLSSADSPVNQQNQEQTQKQEQTQTQQRILSNSHLQVYQAAPLPPNLQFYRFPINHPYFRAPKFFQDRVASKQNDQAQSNLKTKDDTPEQNTTQENHSDVLPELEELKAAQSADEDPHLNTDLTDSIVVVPSTLSTTTLPLMQQTPQDVTARDAQHTMNDVTDHPTVIMANLPS